MFPIKALTTPTWLCAKRVVHLNTSSNIAYMSACVPPLLQVAFRGLGLNLFPMTSSSVILCPDTRGPGSVGVMQTTLSDTSTSTNRITITWTVDSQSEISIQNYQPITVQYLLFTEIMLARQFRGSGLDATSSCIKHALNILLKVY